MLEQQGHIGLAFIFEIGRRLTVIRDCPLIIPLALKAYGVVPFSPVVDLAGGSAVLDSVYERQLFFAKSIGACCVGKRPERLNTQHYGKSYTGTADEKSL
ncbi:MAG: hypothetical protein HFF79_07995 [Oscillospiraceae bacterium]|nr:hypothetical protein [Oscillospiraceae bacterium]